MAGFINSCRLSIFLLIMLSSLLSFIDFPQIGLEIRASLGCIQKAITTIKGEDGRKLHPRTDPGAHFPDNRVHEVKRHPVYKDDLRIPSYSYGSQPLMSNRITFSISVLNSFVQPAHGRGAAYAPTQGHALSKMSQRRRSSLS